MKRRRPLMRSGTPGPRARMKRSPQALTAADHAAYTAATERARTPEGYLVCERCGWSLLDGQEQRHHIGFRSQGGATTEENLRVLCVSCHATAHGIRTRSRNGAHRLERRSASIDQE